MSQKDFLTPKPKTVEILSFRWCGIVTSTQAGELECSRCDKPIGNKKPFGIAFVKDKDSNKQQSLRLCNECGLEAESKLSEQYDSDICGLCGQPGADKIPHPEHWPGERIPDSEFVHAECEDEECKRAHACLTPKQRQAVLNGIAGR